MPDSIRVILIGGTSHVDKSTLARALADELGWEAISTDSLGRHPGRPWRPPGQDLPEHVVQHYLSLTPDALAAAQLAHYRNMWPALRDLILARAQGAGADPLVLEGSGVWPEAAATLEVDGLRGVWLTAQPDVIEARIRRESGYAAASPEARRLIDLFTARSQIYDVEMMRAVRGLGLPYLEVDETTQRAELADRCKRQLAL